MDGGNRRKSKCAQSGSERIPDRTTALWTAEDGLSPRRIMHFPPTVTDDGETRYDKKMVLFQLPVVIAL